MAGGLLDGKVLKAIRGHYWVETTAGTYHCYARESLLKSMKSLAPIVVGDDVVLEILDDPTKEGMIVKVLPRRTKLSRQVSTGTREFEHVVAANVDSLVIVSSVDEPPLCLGLIDRYLVAAAKGNLNPIICINKIDLAPVAHREQPVGAGSRTGLSERTDDAARSPGVLARGNLPQRTDADSLWRDDPLPSIVRLYQSLNYAVVLTSAKTGEGVDELRQLLRDRSSVFAGHSGVGKSSLLRMLHPGIQVKVADVNPRTGRGRHTTTAAELVRLPSGGYVIDTPGIRQLSLWNLTPEDVRRYFVEIANCARYCKFNDCSHTVEPECAVRDAIAEGTIHLSRYESFLKLQEESKTALE